MERIKEILEAPITQQGAHQLITLYKEHTGGNLGVGCLCKSANINQVYDKVRAWVETQQ